MPALMILMFATLTALTLLMAAHAWSARRRPSPDLGRMSERWLIRQRAARPA